LTVTPEMYAERRKQGKCTTCNLPVEGDLRNRATGKKRTMCRSCLKKNADKMEKCRNQRRKKGLCQRCGKRPPKKNRTLCVLCVTACSISAKKRRNAQFFDKKARFLKTYSVGFAKELCFLWKRQRGKCALSGRRLNRANAHLDHRIPRSQSGSDDISNLQWLHRDVNQAKHALTDAEFIQLCQEIISHAESKAHA
jgi:hypothetical protein